MDADVLVDVLVVGAGPAGLTAAAELRRLGVRRVLVADREAAAGGVPRHSFHAGYGLRDLHRVLSGPSYAKALTDAATRAGAELRTGCTVTELRAASSDPGDGALSAVLTSGSGIEEVRPAAVLLATGCRERPRAARLVPGDRPSGVLTTGELQQRVYLGGERLPGRALVIGAEHVSFSAAVTLAHAGAQVLALVTDQPRHQSYAAFKLGAALRWRVPVWTSTAVTRVAGVAGRLAAVDVTRVTGADGRPAAVDAAGMDGVGSAGVGSAGAGSAGAAGLADRRARAVECEWLVFTGDWIPDHVLARTAGVTLDVGTLGPAIDTTMATSTPGVFAAGNLVHAAETADVAALSGRHAARQIAAYLAQRGSPTPSQSASASASASPSPSAAPVPVVAEPPLRWISPNAVRVSGGAAVLPPRSRFAIRPAEFRHRARLEAWQDGRLLARSRPLRLVPGRPVHLRAAWVTSVDPAGGPVSVGTGRVSS